MRTKAALAFGFALAACRAEDVATSRASMCVDDVRIEEYVRFDATGLLEQAVVKAGDETIEYRPAEQLVRIATNGTIREWRVPGHEPWILPPVRGSRGPVATPLSAWASYRAARDAEWIRVLDPTQQTSWVVPRDQVLVDRTLVIGYLAVEIDDASGRPADALLKNGRAAR